MQLLRLLALIFISYVLMLGSYILAATAVGYYALAPEVSHLRVLGGLLWDVALSLTKDSCWWIAGAAGPYDFLPTAGVVSVTSQFRGLALHGVLNVCLFFGIGNFALRRGFSFGATLLVPVGLLGLTLSLLKARLVMLPVVSPAEIGIVVGAQAAGLLIGSFFSSSRRY